MLKKIAGLFRKAPLSAPIVPVKRIRYKTDEATGTLTFEPPSGLHTGTVVLMHGLGTDARLISDAADVWNESLPHIKFILPLADKRSVFVNREKKELHAWFDMNQNGYDGIYESADRISDILANEHSLGIPYSRMVLAGFSQGGPLALFTGLQLPDGEYQKLAGIVVLGGRLTRIGASLINVTPGLERTPILHCHGQYDKVVPPEWAEMTQMELRMKKVHNYVIKECIATATSFRTNPEMLSDVSEFLARVLPATNDDDNVQFSTEHPPVSTMDNDTQEGVVTQVVDATTAESERQQQAEEVETERGSEKTVNSTNSATS